MKAQTVKERRRFLAGFASAFDLFGVNGPRITEADLLDGPRRDAEALRDDWIAVGGDLRTAMDKARHEFQNQ
ncbi:MAG: hypothetical protein WCQ50_11475 [Spirochaetota bacterium]